MSPKPRDEDDKSKKYVERGIDSERAAEEKAADTHPAGALTFREE
jgi:hypothetical protein